jgi:hypothetical protein
MSVDLKSLTKENSTNRSLTDIFQEIETAKKICETTTLCLLILRNGKSGLAKTKLNKISAFITTLFGTNEQKEKVILYSYGTHLMNFNLTVQYLENNNLIKKDYDKYVITESGISWISNKLSKLEEDNSMFDKIIEQIDTCLFTDISSLIKKTLSSDQKWNYKKGEVTGNNLILMFDWSKYGHGMVYPYIYTLLYSFSKVENFLKNVWKENNESTCPIDYSKIPNSLPSTLLLRRRKLKNVPLTNIFEKSLPPYLTVEKFEGKNYISNLWYIVEGVNILNALTGIAPTINEISMICLTNYQHAILDNKVDTDSLKKMRESLIRNDINKLTDYGILLRDKFNRKYRYRISSKCFYDTILDRNFEVVDEQILEKIYKNKIKVYVDSRF